MSRAWENFSNNNNLSDIQIAQFKIYYNLLIEYNKKYNLTAITDLNSVINDHFDDSLALSRIIDLEQYNYIADIGSGAGFPGLALKIKNNNLKVILIEVINKKIEFLEKVISELKLDNIEICNLDWRTFLRKTKYKIDYFCARASLPVKELLRAFNPSCHYKDSYIVYWASYFWHANKKEENFIENIYDYQITGKKRRLIFFKNK